MGGDTSEFDLFTGEFYPILALIAGIVFVGALMAFINWGGSKVGDCLDHLGIFDVSISRRPRTRAAARRYEYASRHPERRTSANQAALLLGFLLLCFGLFMAWLFLSLANTQTRT